MEKKINITITENYVNLKFKNCVENKQISMFKKKKVNNEILAILILSYSSESAAHHSERKKNN